MALIVPDKNEKKVNPTNCVHIEKMNSLVLTPVVSPYPTVVIVVIMQYTDFMYISYTASCRARCSIYASSKCLSTCSSPCSAFNFTIISSLWWSMIYITHPVRWSSSLSYAIFPIAMLIQANTCVRSRTKSISLAKSTYSFTFYFVYPNPFIKIFSTRTFSYLKNLSQWTNLASLKKST